MYTDFILISAQDLAHLHLQFQDFYLKHEYLKCTTIYIYIFSIIQTYSKL